MTIETSRATAGFALFSPTMGNICHCRDFSTIAVHQLRIFSDILIPLDPMYQIFFSVIHLEAREEKIADNM